MTVDLRALPDVSDLTVGILGGTGPQGRGLAYRLARAGQRVVIGSRSTERGQNAARELAALPGCEPSTIDGGDNHFGCTADIVIVAVPFEGHAELLTELRPSLAGKLVVDCVNPLGFDKQGAFPLTVEEGSAAQQAAALLPESTVCAAFPYSSLYIC